VKTAIVPFAIALVIGCNRRDPGEKNIKAVRVHTVETTQAVESSRYSANIIPGRRVDLAFKVGGYIEEILQVKASDGKSRSLQEGDWVKEGQILARIRATDYQQKTREVRAIVTEAEAALQVVKLEWDRARQLFEKGGISKSQFDAARAAHNAAQARVDAARAGLGQVSSVASDTALRSPIEGVVMKRFIEVGSLVGPGTPGFVVADTRSVKAAFGVPDALVDTLKIGTSVDLNVEALVGKTFTGQISRVAPAADVSTRVFEVEITIPNDAEALKVGMVATLRLSTEAPRWHVLLPLAAIVRSKTNPSGYAVYLVKNQGEVQVAKLVDVELGEFLGNSIPAKSGVLAEDKVIVMGASLVSDGERVQVIP
jgi:RND family efflux transporter MFP subunit